MSHTVGMGVILIEQGTPMPPALNVSTAPYVRGWSAVTNLTRWELGRQLTGLGWTFFSRAGEGKTTGFGFDEQARLHRAIAKTVKAVQRETDTCVEITQITRKSFGGVPRIEVRAHSRHIPRGPLFHRVPGIEP